MKLILALFVLVSSMIASAQTRVISIDALDMSYTGGLLFRNDNANKNNKDVEETTFRLNLNYAEALEQYVGLMWKAKAYINRTDIDAGGDNLDSRFGAAGGLLYNFQSENIKDSFFAGTLLGLERQNIEIGNADDSSGFNIFIDLEVGKRFDLGKYSAANIAYAPSLGLMFKRYGDEIREDYYKTGSEIRLNFLKFDILF
ncbi:MAG TPA: hypothetical protein VNJ01_10210 [Bacteriovoracaceae bacterium]|nr:hypothetical protein [Bacteriovoracaceae bacterium]